jgi:hypothetical protein
MRVRRWAHLVGQWGRRPEAGMTTAEYAVGTLAACAFAAVLLAVVKSGGISTLVTEVITMSLSVGL